MRIAALYWFYCEPELSANHLACARTFNPDTPFYGLYGGEPAEAARYQALLAPLLDDFHVYREARDPRWKWRHGDRLIVDWYLHRGRHLEWDTVAVVQWDTLVCAPLDQLFATLAADELLLPGLRPLAEVESDWWWTSPCVPVNRAEFLRFRAHLEMLHGAPVEPACCLFVTACLPRAFLDAYACIDKALLGFLEYKLPMYAQVFGLPAVRGRGLDPWWNAGPPMGPVEDFALNAVGHEVPVATMLRSLRADDGARLFHPVRRPVSVTVSPRR